MNREDFLRNFQAYLDGAAIRHFRAGELCDPGRARVTGGGDTVRLRPPPAELWAHILPTLRVMEWLRAEFGGRPLRVVSGYRDPAYNRAVGGAEHSLHVAFNAADLFSDSVAPRQLARRLAAHPDADRFGIGLYPTFVHLDTRGTLGHSAPARWGTPDRWWK